jgi:hypothetical protein
MDRSNRRPGKTLIAAALIAAALTVGGTMAVAASDEEAEAQAFNRYFSWRAVPLYYVPL